MLEYETIRMTCSARDTWCHPLGMGSAWEGDAGDTRLTSWQEGTWPQGWPQGEQEETHHL